MLKAILSQKIEPSMVVASNVVDDDAPAWTENTVFAQGERTVHDGRVYESAVASNSGQTPSSSSEWFFVHAAKSTRPFDQRLTAPASRSGTIEFTIAPVGLVRAVALVGVSASMATIRVRSADGDILIEQTKGLADYTEMVDGLTMALVEPALIEQVVFDDVICAPGSLIEIVIGDGSGSPAVSEIVLGDTLSIGTATFGAGDDLQDFSDFTEDRFGNVDIVERGYREVKRIPVKVTTDHRPRIMRKMRPFRAKFLFFFLDQTDRYGLNIYGRFERLSTTLEGPTVSDMTLKILGATYAYTAADA